MTTEPQFYLVTSANIPSDLWIFTQDEADVGDKDFDGRMKEDFGQVLTPLGDDPAKFNISVPTNTKFAGILWGDGEHFDMDRDPTWGIPGEIERVGMNHCRIRGADGTVIAEFTDNEEECGGIPHVMPPEAFGLQRKPWWNQVYPWCND